MTKKELVKEATTRSVDKIYPSKEALERVLASGKKLKLYLGVDPTGPHLHLGHLTNLLVLKRFQALGHKVIFLVGDFTGRIGDPSGRNVARRPLSQKEVADNLRTFQKQASRVFSFSGRNAAKLEFNSRWYKKMRVEDLLKLAGNFTFQQIVKRDMFQKRIEEDKQVNLTEFLYPVLQGYDSVAMNVDLEVGGTDQTFNMLVGRDLMRTFKKKEKFVLTTRILENSKTGKKLMNKSEGGMVNLDDSPDEIFGKVMALPDEATRPVAEFSSEMSMAEVFSLDEMNPKDAKAKVAEAVVATVYNGKSARVAATKFDQLFSKRKVTGELPTLSVKEKVSVIDLVLASGIAKSKSEARRLIIQGGFKVDGKAWVNPRDVLNLKGGENLKVGKKSFFRVRIR